MFPCKMGTPGPYFTRENRDGVPILMGSPKFYDTGYVISSTRDQN